jgi:hypothetical protein
MQSRYPNNDHKDKSGRLLKKIQNIIRTVFSALTTIFFKIAALSITLPRWFKSGNNVPIQEITPSKNEYQEIKTKEGNFMSNEQEIKVDSKEKNEATRGKIKENKPEDKNGILNLGDNSNWTIQKKAGILMKVYDIKAEEQAKKNKINDLNKKIKEQDATIDIKLNLLKEKQNMINALKEKHDMELSEVKKEQVQLKMQIAELLSKYFIPLQSRKLTLYQPNAKKKKIEPIEYKKNSHF